MLLFWGNTFFLNFIFPPKVIMNSFLEISVSVSEFDLVFYLHFVSHGFECSRVSLTRNGGPVVRVRLF